jgi:hypothetical protein
MSYDASIAQGLVDEVLDLLHKYDDSLLLPTVLGCLDLIKLQLIEDHMCDDEDDEE